MPKETCCQIVSKFLIRYVLVPIGLFFAIFFAPFNRLLDNYTFCWFQSRNVTTPSEHRKKVARVQEQVKKWHSAGRKSRMCTAKAAWNTWTVHALNKRELAQIDVDPLHCVVEIDEVNHVLTVEPGLMMGQLTSILLPKGWTIPLVPEFETLTVGGVICGTGIESNSTRVGLSSDCCLEYEIVLSNGDLVTCSKDVNSDLFYSIPWSHGTLGFLTAVKMPLIRARKYVQLEYHAVNSIQEAQSLLETQDHEFVEGMAFGRRSFVVMHGDMVDEVDPKLGRVNQINRWYKPFFYKHVKSFTTRSRQKLGARPHVEYIPLREYYHRHTRSYFWEITSAFPSLSSPLFRIPIGWILPAVNAKSLKRLGMMFTGPAGDSSYALFYILNHVLQDFIVPIKKLESALDLVHETVEVYPLWLCPCKFFKKPGMVHSSNTATADTELYIDIGVYGTTPKKAEYHSEDTIRKLEAFCLENGGVQFLYADSFLSREEFWRMFDMSLYEEVRTKYRCTDAFPDVYDKVSKTARKIQV